jgi:hypothetical protein
MLVANKVPQSEGSDWKSINESIFLAPKRKRMWLEKNIFILGFHRYSFLSSAGILSRLKPRLT